MLISVYLVGSTAYANLMPAWTPYPRADADEPMRWGSCGDTLMWHVEAGAPEKFVTAVTEQFRTIDEHSAATIAATSASAGRADIVLRWEDDAGWDALRPTLPHPDNVAVTSLWTDGGDQIVEAEVHFQAEYFDAYPETLNAVVLHELGHVMGLGHTPRWGSIMAEGYKTEARLSDGDRAGLEAVGPTC